MLVNVLLLTQVRHRMHYYNDGTYQLTQYQSFFLESTGPTNSVNLLILSSSLGSLLAIALLACGVLVAILVSISRKKGL